MKNTKYESATKTPNTKHQTPNPTMSLNNTPSRRASSHKHSQQQQEAIRVNLEQYAKEKVERVLKAMLHDLFLKTPQDPIQVEY